ncbi:CHAT domain-containing protein [Cognatiyoonia sp. IB215446]|uniref:CHAT domain-containing protein n=1 Tax=Cognatiyoonia sp. IB215446 TaxID=3097355 RepID=UPI002A0F6BC3|nr:CHAT domain-containing protein [Cognatiyoonia sp. IB215446]MDX8347405.1 CHAT domain-containing protein [Cognatiyoonia sp. IB215446]
MEYEVYFKRVMTAFADAEFDRRLQEWVFDIAGDDVSVRSAPTCADVLKRIEKFAPDLLIIDLALPLDETRPKDRLATSGLEFVESEHFRKLLRAKQISLIVLDQIDAGTSVELRVGRIPFARMFPYARLPERDVFEALESLMIGLYKSWIAPVDMTPPVPAERPVLTVEVVLEENRYGRVKLHLTNEPPRDYWKAINPQEYDYFNDLSGMFQRFARRGFDGDDDWRIDAARIGEKIYTCIFGNELQTSIQDWLEKSELTDEDMRIRITTPSDQHRILFEALTTSYEGGFKAIDTPMARQLQITNDTFRPGPRLREADALNVLVIDASKTEERTMDLEFDADFRAWLNRLNLKSGHVPKFKTLKHGADEIKMFKDLRDAIRDDNPWPVFPDVSPVDLLADVREVRILNPDELGCQSPADFEKQIGDTLRARAQDGNDWHIVHYVGHSVAAQAHSGKSGFLILPGGKNVAPFTVNSVLAELPGAGTRFLYFSSCQFGSAEVALSTAQWRVPSSIGFRWNVNDKSALIFASYFYHALFCERLAVDEAVRDARRKTKEKTPDSDLAWVSAVFTCYGQRWHGGWGERLRRRETAA